MNDKLCENLSKDEQQRHLDAKETNFQLNARRQSDKTWDPESFSGLLLLIDI